MEAYRPRPAAAPTFVPSPPTADELAAFAASLSGAVVIPSDPDYDTAREVHNSRFDRRPSLVVRAADAADVAAAVRFATGHGLEIAVRSGGHSLKGDGTTEGGLVIDLAALKGLLIDPEQKLAWAGAGLTAGEVTNAAAAHGLAVPFGDTASVGIGGLTTGGGIGFLTRKHGLTVDHVVAAELVTADGRIVTVDEAHDPDLFWAIRGGGGNVGVVTRFVYRLVEVGMVVGGGLVLPATADTIAGLVAAGHQAPDELTLISYVMFAPPLPFIPAERVGELVLMVLGVATGDLEAGQAAWAPIRALSEPIADLVGPMPYPAIYQFTEAGAARGGGSIRSWFADDLTIADAECVLALMREAGNPAVMTQIRVLGGAMARVAPGATAFSQRDAGVLVAAMGLFEIGADPAPADAWTTRAYEVFAPRRTGVYANFLGDEGEARVRSAYPHGAYETLASIKRRHDPRNVFRLNQNVAPA
jgi:FAD/FMN-containing dehydrogenase